LRDHHIISFCAGLYLKSLIDIKSVEKSSEEIGHDFITKLLKQRHKGGGNDIAVLY